MTKEPDDRSEYSVHEYLGETAMAAFTAALVRHGAMPAGVPFDLSVLDLDAYRREASYILGDVFLGELSMEVKDRLALVARDIYLHAADAAFDQVVVKALF